jgi:hypothetical protein
MTPFATADPESLLTIGPVSEEPLIALVPQFLDNERTRRDVNMFDELVQAPGHVRWLDAATRSESMAVDDQGGRRARGGTHDVAVARAGQCWGYMCLHCRDLELAAHLHVHGAGPPEVHLRQLNTAQDITVFAPTNDASGKIPKADLDNVLADQTTLTKILTYHVVPRRLTPEQLAGTHRTLEGGELTVTGSGASFTVNGNSAVVCGNVQTSNATV